MPPARAGTVTALATAFALVACRRAVPPPAADEGPAWPVLYAGCAAVAQGPVCLVGPERHLTVWIPGPVTAVVSADAGAVTISAREAVDGGERLALVLPAQARTLTAGPRADRPRWRLALGDAPVFPAIAQARALQKANRADELGTFLASARPTLPPEAQSLADGLLARGALARSRIQDAGRLFATSMAGARQAGRLSDYVNDGFAWFWALVSREQRFSDARRLLDELRPIAATYPEGRVTTDYNEAILAVEEGDFRTSLERLRSANRQATRLALDRIVRATDTERSIVLATLGRSAEAVELLRKRSRDRTNPCEAATVLMDLLWALSRQQPELASAEVEPVLRDARSTVAACKDPYRERMLALNEVERSIRDRRLSDARTTLDRLARETPAEQTDRLVEWQSELGGRLSLEEGHAAAAREQLERARALAQAAGRESSQLLAEVGIGRALLALGRRADGIATLTAAQDRMSRLQTAIPLGEGQSRFAAAHEQGAQHLVSALVDSGKAGAAFAAARRVRAGALAQAARLDRLVNLSPAERGRWEEAIGRHRRLRLEMEKEAAGDWALSRAALDAAVHARQAQLDESRVALDQAYAVLRRPGDETRPLETPGPGELFLGYFPAPGGWLGFAATARRVRAVALGPLEPGAAPAALAHRLLEPFDRELAAATRVRLLPYGALERLDLHALPWRGQPLVAGREVSYGLDLGAVRARPALPEDGPTLVLADPGNDLPQARVEAADVARALAPRPTHLLIGDAATRDATLSLLGQARLFHFSGHARSQGAEGMESAFSVAHGRWIDPGDLLALAAVPPLVVLSACEAAAPSERGPLQWGLAQSFLAAGSQVVVAPVRPVKDAAARAFSVAFHQALATAEGRPAAAFRSASVSMTRQPGEEDWSAFRLLVP